MTVKVCILFNFHCRNSNFVYQLYNISTKKLDVQYDTMIQTVKQLLDSNISKP